MFLRKDELQGSFLRLPIIVCNSGLSQGGADLTSTDFGQVASTDSWMEEVIWSHKISRSEGILLGSSLELISSEYCIATVSSWWREEIIGLLLGIKF